MDQLKMTFVDFTDEIMKFLHRISADRRIVVQRDPVDRRTFQVRIGDRERILELHEPFLPSDFTEENSPPMAIRDERAIHIWKDLWIWHQEKIESKLRSAFGLTDRIHGRKTRIVEIDNKALLEFLRANHLNVPIKGKIKYGLEHRSQLVAAMSFSKSRPIQREGKIYHSYELLRFCNQLNKTVVGGFSRLLSHFVKLHDPDDIMTYVDADWSNGALYERSGFVWDGQLLPMVFLLDPTTGERKYPHLELGQQPRGELKITFTESEVGNLAGLGYQIVHNSGSYKYLWLRK